MLFLIKKLFLKKIKYFNFKCIKYTFFFKNLP